MRRCCTPAPEGSTARTIAGLDKKLVRKWGRSGADIGGKPKEDVALRPLKPRIVGLGKKLVRQRPRLLACNGVARAMKKGPEQSYLWKALMLEKNTPDRLRPGPTDDPRIASLDKRVIRKRAPRR